jgi:hypothetical protein
MRQYVHVRVTQGNELVADLPEWEWDIPEVGDYLFHPPQLGQPSEPENLSAIAGCVTSRVWRMYERLPRMLRASEEGFRQTHRPYVEIRLGS